MICIVIVTQENLFRSDREEMSGAANQYSAHDCRLFCLKLDARKPNACPCYEKSK